MMIELVGELAGERRGRTGARHRAAQIQLQLIAGDAPSRTERCDFFRELGCGELLAADGLIREGVEVWLAHLSTLLRIVPRSILGPR